MEFKILLKEKILNLIIKRDMMSIYKKIGIYGIRNKINGKIYVGQTSVSFGDRKDCHYAKLRHNKNDNINLQNEWNYFGENNFEFIILEEVNDISVLDTLEQKYISLYQPNVYNISTGGKGAPGIKLSEKAKRIIGEKNKVNMTGKKASEETRRKMSLTRTGRKMSPEAVIKSANSRRGRKATKEQIEKNRISHQGTKSNLAKHTEEEIRQAKIMIKNNIPLKEISETLNISMNVIYSLVKNTRWKHVII